MKTAVVFSGFFRTFPFVQESFRTCIMEPLDADIFFSSPTTMFALKQNEATEWHYFHSASDRLFEPEIIEFFGPRLKSHELWEHSAEPYKELCKQNGVPDFNFANQHTYRIASQLHSRELAMNLFRRYVEEHGLTYDLVIAARGDVKYYTPFNTAALDLGKINCPTHAWMNGNLNVLPSNAVPSDKIHKAFNDQILAGSQKNMLVWGNLASKAIEYFKDGMHYNTESLMAQHLIKNGIDWQVCNFSEYELWRHERY